MNFTASALSRCVCYNVSNSPSLSVRRCTDTGWNMRIVIDWHSLQKLCLDWEKMCVRLGSLHVLIWRHTSKVQVAHTQKHKQTDGKTSSRNKRRRKGGSSTHRNSRHRRSGEEDLHAPGPDVGPQTRTGLPAPPLSQIITWPPTNQRK